ncbi:phytoene desaturase family protein [Agilicoccus flavus]|uniref:phytoene desaturase family protein n=1 Tax=Agilicoccus flavus TaxID=2775968 RepID=UPI001CF6ED1D|nr:NAD(P)/FAD-dependent oxidoreductase [Agilicoccus flavus]
MTDATVVGSGPNGLAAAVVLARAGLSVHVIEGQAGLGGGARTLPLTLPGFLHDACSAVHPSAMTSEFFTRFELTRRVEFVVPDVSYAHPLPGGRVGLAHRDVEATAAALGPDGPAWLAFMRPLIAHAAGIADLTGGSLLRLPHDLLGSAWFGARVGELAGPWRTARFSTDVPPALLAGCLAHAVAEPASLAAAGAGIKLATEAHVDGWPLPIGGSQAIVDAMLDDLRDHGARFTTGTRVTSLDEIDSPLRVLDVSARGLLDLAGDRLPPRYARALRTYTSGHGTAKLDLALSGPIPWRSPEIGASPTVHLGGSWRDIHAAERAVQAGRHPTKPYVLLCQPSLLDATRAPAGGHVVWAYTHVPHGAERDMTEAILDVIEAEAPGVRDLVLGAHSRTAADLAAENPNAHGGEIMGGALTMRQIIARPTLSPTPWRTPLRGVYLASASTSPGPAVHGLCGMHAARTALSDLYGMTELPDLAPEALRRAPQGLR